MSESEDERINIDKLRESVWTLVNVFDWTTDEIFKYVDAVLRGEVP